MCSENSKLSEILDDDSRMTVLFSPMRERDLNPKSWQQKVNFWTEVIYDDCLQCQQSIIDSNSLKEQYRRRGKSPACLRTVLDEMCRSGVIQRLTDWQNQTEGNSWLSWGYKMVKAPVGWGWKMLPWQQKSQTDDGTESYVVKDVIKKKASALIDSHCQSVDAVDIVDYTDLREQRRELCPSDLEFSLVMQHLCQTKQVIVQEGKDNAKLVKFLKGAEKKASEKINDQDIRIHRIRQAHASVTQQIEKLAIDVKRLGQEAVNEKRQGMTKSALRTMRKRRTVQTHMDQLSGSLETLEDILYKIKQAGSNELVLRAMEDGNAALKELTEKTKMEDINKTMDDLAELNQTHEDIAADLSSFLSTGDEPSQAELEEELDDILLADGPAAGSSPSRGQASPVRGQSSPARGQSSPVRGQSSPPYLGSDTSSCDLSDLLADLQLPDVPVSPLGRQMEEQTSKKNKQALLS